MREIRCDVAIFGGGAAGLWLLDDLTRSGHSAVLLEAYELGRGQTIASQGIIHGGLKYSLDGLLSASASAIRDMPQIWRDCLAGNRRPDLRATRIRAQFCHLWRSSGLKARIGMLGAKIGLRVVPVKIAPQEYPAALAGCPSEVFRLDEQVIDPASFVACLAEQHAHRLLKFDPDRLDAAARMRGEVNRLTIANADNADHLQIASQTVVLTAGEGNAALLDRFGLSAPAMQRRPLHMVMARGSLPLLNGHCTEGSTPSLTITTEAHRRRPTVWQIGGQVAEDGVDQSPVELIRHAAQRVRSALPRLDLSDVEWATYRVDRAEPAMPGGGRPSKAFVHRTGNVVTAWPTKLALVPELARRVRELIGDVCKSSQPSSEIPSEWPRPGVARPPWEHDVEWCRAD